MNRLFSSPGVSQGTLIYSIESTPLQGDGGSISSVVMSVLSQEMTSKSQYKIAYCSLSWGHEPRLTICTLNSDDEGSWTAVVRGAALIGLGIGCEAPPPCRACPYHIGVAASAEFRDYYPERETPHLVYVDEFDGKPRLKDQIKWLVAKGDLITAEDGIEKTVKIVRKMTRTGNRVGSVVVVLSTDREKGHEGTL